MGLLINSTFDVQTKLYLAFTLISFFALLTYLVPDEEWGFDENPLTLADRVLFTFNIHAGLFGYTNPKLFPRTDNARWMLLMQRVSSYVFRLIMLC